MSLVQNFDRIQRETGVGEDLVKKLQLDGKEVDTLGFVRQRKKPYYSFSKTIFGFFFKSDFKWNYKSKSFSVNNFINTEFDILMDLSPASGSFFYKLIAGKSKAKFKLGRYNSNYYIYDLLIEVDDYKSSEELVGNYFHYLKTIKSRETYA